METKGRGGTDIVELSIRDIESENEKQITLKYKKLRNIRISLSFYL